MWTQREAYIGNAGVLGLAIALLALFALSFPFDAGAQVKSGALHLTVVGLPRGEAAQFSLDGPRPGGGRTKRSVSLRHARTLSHLPVGSYRITVKKVKISRRHQTIKRGAVASPISSHLKVRVRPGRAAKADLRYGAIVNPGVQSASGEILQVLGDPTDPSEVVLRNGSGVHRGTILSAHPSAVLPQGLLSRVTAVTKRHHKVRAKLAPAGIYEVAPNMSFDIPLSAAEAAQASSVIKCGPSGSSFSPFARISDIHLTGGWTTTHVLFADITNGATVELHFKASAGVDVTAGGAFSCSVPLPSLSVEGMAGPIPVYGAITPKAKGEIASQGSVHTEGSTEITLGTSVKVPDGAKPILSFGSPQFSVTSALFTGIKASVGLDAELGVGVANAANLHLSMGNSLDFVASPGNCSWDLNLGSFGVGGKIGFISIDGPSTPPIYHRNLWHRTCGSAPPAPSPPPAPAPSPPPPPGPLTRATMSWDTDSDIDLYTWDSEGNVLYYGEREGIPNAQLVEDVIPVEGEISHPPELFQEAAVFNRPYTFGICDYHGEGGDVTLTVVDPGGATRTFHHTLLFEGDSEVITSSPLGPDYSPPFEWCHYRSEFEFE